MTGSADRTVRLWETASGKLLKTFPDPSANRADPSDIRPSAEVMHVEISADGAYLVSVGRDNVAILWNAATGKPCEIDATTAGAAVDQRRNP